MGAARTLDKGQAQFMMAAEVLNAPTGTLISGVVDRFTYPQAELGLRYGIFDRLEIGAKAWLIGGGLDLKIALLRSPTMEEGIDVSIDPGIGVLSLSGLSSSSTLTFPVLVGFNVGGGNQLVVGPKSVTTVNVGADGRAITEAVGLTAGFACKLAPNIWVFPEMTFTYPVYQTLADPGLRGLFFQGGVGLLVGGWKE